MVHFVGVY